VANTRYEVNFSSELNAIQMFGCICVEITIAKLSLYIHICRTEIHGEKRRKIEIVVDGVSTAALFHD